MKIGPLKLTGRYCPLVMHGEIQLFRVVSSDYGKLCFRGCSKSQGDGPKIHKKIVEAFLGGCLFFDRWQKPGVQCRLVYRLHVFYRYK